MSLISSGERQITFLSSQFTQKDELWLLLAGACVLLAFLLLLLVCRKRKKKSGGRPVTGDTADMPAFQDIYLEHYGFQVLEDITCMAAEGRIMQEEEGDTGWDG